MTVACPECDNPLDLDAAETAEGDIVTCDDCGSELEVLSIDPPHLVVVGDEGYGEEDGGRAPDADGQDMDE